MLIRLNLNENPYLPPKNVIENAKKGLEAANRYCDFELMEKLREELEDYTKIPKDKIIIAPGSDFLLREAIHTFSANRKIIMVNPSFFPALECAKAHVEKLIRIQLIPPKFNLNYGLIMNEIDEKSLIIIDNPNNPTGQKILSKEIVENILEKGALLLVDEAYYEFSGITFSDLIDKYPNLSITRSMDKGFSLAGFRLGYMLVGEHFKNALSDFITFLPRVSVYAGIEALKNREYMKENVKRIINERERMKKELKTLGLEVFESDTNFILIRSKISDLGEKLRQRGILIKDLSYEWLSGFYRITVGKNEENDILLKALGEIV